MEKIKILHCGDIHLDTPFREFNETISKSSRKDIKNVLRNIINICNEEFIDILLIAGDFFDNNSVKKDTLEFIKDVFKMLKNTNVFISPGNHDPFYEKSFYTLVEWPKNVYIFKGELERIDLDKVSIHGFAFNKKYEIEGLLKNIHIKNENINILVGHGEVEVRESEYNPISKEEIRCSGLDYAALGHIHTFKGINKEGKTYYAYSGCPQGRGFDEDGQKGVLIGEVGKDYANLKFLKTSIREFKNIEVNITDLENNLQVEEGIMKATEEKKRKDNFFKVILKGEIEPKVILDIDEIKENLKDKFYFIKVIDKTTVKINKEDINENSAKGLFIKYIEDLDGDAEILNLALSLGLKSLIDEEVKLDDY